VTFTRKNAKSQKRTHKLRSPGTKGGTRVGRKEQPHRDLEQQLEACRRELAEARDQQIAASEILNVISRSPGELERTQFKAKRVIDQRQLG
jgi:ribosomal protein L19E